MAAGGGRLMSFVTEKEAEEIKRRKQEQWEKVRKPGDPLEHPQEVAYDPRSLYERLKEQKDRKQEEYEEQFKFKNMIYKGLDDDEAGFLNLVAYQQANRDAELLQLEREEISAFKEAVSQLNEAELEKSKSSQPTLVSPTRTSFIKPPSKSQLSLIAGAIKRKRSSSETSTENTPTSDESTTLAEKKAKTLDAKSSSPKASTTSKATPDNTGPSLPLVDTDKPVNNKKPTGLVHLALYSSSSDEEDNTNDER